MKSLFIILPLILFSCTNSKKKVEETLSIERIAVLSPSSAQTLIDIGLGDKIACVTKPFKFDKRGDDFTYLGYYHNPSLELIIQCKPDLIIASYAGTPPGLYRRLEGLGYKLILERPESLRSIRDFIVKMSMKFKRPLPEIAKKFDTICIEPKNKNAVILVGLNPIISAGDKSFLSSALECSGFDNMIKGAYPRLSIEFLINMDPDLLILAFNNPEEIKDYATLKRVFNEKLIVLDPEDLLEPSTKILSGIEKLKKL